MGRFEFGVYVYVWTWVLLLGALVSLGLPSAAQRFIPEYLGRGDLDRLRGFLFGSRWLAFGLGTIASAIGIALVLLFRRRPRNPTTSCRSSSPACACRSMR